MKKILIFTTLIANICYGQVNLNQGLIAFYPFSGNANDVTANNINGVISNATLTTDRFGNANSAYYFNGSNAYIQLPYSALYNFAPQDSFSISVRVLPDQGNSWPAQALVVKSPFHADFNQSNWNYGTYALNYKAMGGYAINSVVVGTTVFTGTPCWYNIVVTYKNGIWRMYVNGVLEASDLSQTKFILQDGPASKINFGKKGDANGDYFKGKMDDVRIYNRVLNATEAQALTDCVNTTSCNNWLNTPTQGSYVTTGDLDITGNQLTVEAVFNRTAPLNGGIYYGHLVSKHFNASDVNYALLPNGCEITTTTGYKSTFQSCPPILNKAYHIAMVYDGTNLKYYRNGFLLSQVACTGNMITNNLQTTIAQVAGGGYPTDNQFLGYTNEVRIWNVARTQAQIQTYMNSSIPNPTTQAGLLGYYTFDNLLNKQGNTAFNATLNGASAINTTNPNCTYVADSCFVSCNNWLRTQAVGQSVTVGDLDISGNQITVEANFNCSSFPITRPDKQQDIVSKHANTTDINYVLRMDLAGITTNNGQFLTPPPCDNLVTNKTYHVALVYDGTTLKLFRNGVVISQIAATGNLILNNWLTTIGDYAVNNPVGTNFLGYINEVRIWNVARTQAQLQTYMNTSLPNPTTQTGLIGYYTFDNLLNKQGNPAWNGTLNAGATINNTNPNCSFTPEQGINVNAGTDTSFCSNGIVSHILQGSGNGTYSWSPAIYLNNPNIQNPTATISTTTTFYLTVTGSPSICSGTDSVTIYVNPLPVVNTIADTTICKLSPLVLTTASNAVSYQWTPAMYVSNPNISNPNFVGTNSQRLYVTGSTGSGCSAIDSVDVFVNPLPVVQTINDTTLCMAQSIILTTTGAQTYSWSPAAGLSNPSIASPFFTGSTQQTYTVTGTDAIGCKNSDAVSIFFSSPDSLKTPPSFTICGQETVQLDGNNGRNVSYLWSPATYLSNATIINPLANPPQTTLYSLLVSDNTCGFDSTFIVLITILPAPQINAGKSNDIDCAFRSATLSASGGDQYTWSPSTGLSSTVIPNPVARPAVTQKYIVRVTNSAGCSNTDSVNVVVNNIASLARYMPNAFTPDGNGLNDCYALKNWMYIKQLQFFIFNRYGEQVFATNNPNTCWDGMYKGKQALAGTYVYVIKAQTDCGVEEQKGSFLLIR